MGGVSAGVFSPEAAGGFRIFSSGEKTRGKADEHGGAANVAPLRGADQPPRRKPKTGREGAAAPAGAAAVSAGATSLIAGSGLPAPESASLSLGRSPPTPHRKLNSVMFCA